jgi:hypothetical protein
MQDQKTAPLAAVLSEALASLALMFADQDVREPAGEGQAWLETTVGYSGPEEGALRFRCTRSFAVRLAASLLGTDPTDIDDERCTDGAVQEFVGIVCGQLVSAVHGSAELYNIGAPRTVRLHWGPCPMPDGALETASLSVDGESIQAGHFVRCR